MDGKPGLDLLLLGKTGVGKSATGNSILGCKAFKSTATFQSATVKSKKGVCELKTGRLLRAVDTPGVGDTRGSKEDGERMFLEAINEAIAMNPLGYHTLLLVMRFGGRLTEDEKDTISYLKTVFGDNFIAQYCIIILTNGDDFKLKQEDGEIEVSFQDWCKQQEGYFQELYQEVNQRVILFDNRERGKGLTPQRQELVSFVDGLMVGGRRYSNRKFEKAKQAREKIMLQDKIPIIYDRVEEETSIILKQMKTIKNEQDIVYKMKALQSLLVITNMQLEDIDQEDNKTDLLSPARDIISKAQKEVESELNYLRVYQEIAQKKMSEDQESQREIKRLRSKLGEYAQQQKQATKTLQELEEKFQQIRDDHNRGIASSVLSAVAWPVTTIRSWLEF